METETGFAAKYLGTFRSYSSGSVAYFIVQLDGKVYGENKRIKGPYGVLEINKNGSVLVYDTNDLPIIDNLLRDFTLRGEDAIIKEISDIPDKSTRIQALDGVKKIFEDQSKSSPA